MWLPKVRIGGWLAGHDYLNTETAPWIHVREAVDRFCSEKGLEIEAVTSEPCSSFVILKKEV